MGGGAMRSFEDGLDKVMLVIFLKPHLHFGLNYH